MVRLFPRRPYLPRTGPGICDTDDPGWLRQRCALRSDAAAGGECRRFLLYDRHKPATGLMPDRGRVEARA
jgi:hypothetical protein